MQWLTSHIGDNRYNLAAVSLLLTFFNTSVWSATDGSLGDSSEGTSVITIIKDDAVQISGVDDLEMGIRGSLTEAQSVSDDLCVFSSTGAYNLTVSSANFFFALTDSNTNTNIIYSLTWTTDTTRAITINTALTSIIGDASSLDCSGGTNASLGVTILPANFNSADPGSYRDTVTLLIQPE